MFNICLVRDLLELAVCVIGKILLQNDDICHAVTVVTEKVDYMDWSEEQWRLLSLDIYSVYNCRQQAP